MKFLTCLLAVLVVHMSALSFAKERPPLLSVGMTYSEILTKAGAPTSKKIMEIKREEEWYYPNFSVLFKDGYVTRLEGSVLPQQSAAPAPLQTQTAKDARKQRETPPDLLRNILKELPVPTGSPSAAGGVGGPQPIAPIVPPGGNADEE